MTVVHIHGTSGINKSDRTCRKKQFRQVFKNLGDGQPGANGRINMIFGDFNTDPHRLDWLDKSARYLQVTAAKHGFKFHTGENSSELRTFRGLVSIDHVLSDHFQGSCTFPGVTPGTEPVLRESYFDHAPVLCTLSR